MTFYSYSTDNKDCIIYEKVISPFGSHSSYIMSDFNTKNSKSLPGCLSWKYSLYTHYLHSQTRNSSATNWNYNQPFSVITWYWILKTSFTEPFILFTLRRKTKLKVYVIVFSEIKWHLTVSMVFQSHLLYSSQPFVWFFLRYEVPVGHFLVGIFTQSSGKIL